MTITADVTGYLIVLSEFEKLKSNMETAVRPALTTNMNGLREQAEELTHYISHRLRSGWAVSDSHTGQTINVKLYNNTEYAETEFDRPGNKESVGTPHDVRPDLEAMAEGNVESWVFEAITKGLRQ